MSSTFRINEKDLDLNNLWNNEKNHFRIWIILFIAFWALITILSLVPLFNALVNKTAYIEALKQQTQNTPNTNNNNITLDFDAVWRTQILIDFFITSFLPILVFTFGISSTIKSYKFKSFAILSTGAILLSKFHGILSIINLINSTLRGNYDISNNFNLIALVMHITILVLSVIHFFFISKNVTKIKQLFMMQKLQRDSAIFMEQWNKNMKNGNINNPFGEMNADQFTNQTSTTDNSQTTNQDEVNQPVQKTEKDLAIEKIIELPKEQLHRMAETLNIFGYEQMSKEELAYLIYNHTKKDKQ